MEFSIFLSRVFSALSLSSILLLISLGLALTFGLMRVINIAHAEFITIGAYVAYIMQFGFEYLFSGAMVQLYFLVAVPVSFLIAGLVGVVLERVLIRHLYGRALDTLLATWGVSIVLRQVIRDIFGKLAVPVQRPEWLAGGLQIVPNLTLPYTRLFILLLAVGVTVGLYVFLYYTRSGRIMRAVLQDRGMASSMGVPVHRVDMLAFGLGSGLAGVAGCALILLGSINPEMGLHYIVDAFLVVITGGVGRLLGTIAGSAGIGFSEHLLEFFTGPAMGRALIFLLVIVFLQWRPEGIFPMQVREEETA